MTTRVHSPHKIWRKRETALSLNRLGDHEIDKDNEWYDSDSVWRTSEYVYLEHHQHISFGKLGYGQ